MESVSCSHEHGIPLQVPKWPKCCCNGKDCINVTLIITSLNLGHFSHDSKIKRYQMVMSVWKYCRKTFLPLMTPLWAFSATVRVKPAGIEVKPPVPLGLEASPPGSSGRTSADMLQERFAVVSVVIAASMDIQTLSSLTSFADHLFIHFKGWQLFCIVSAIFFLFLKTKEKLHLQISGR